MEKKRFNLNFEKRLASFKNIPNFFKIIFKCNPKLTSSNIFLRVLKSSIPILILYIGKLIIDEIIELSKVDEKNYEKIIFII